MGGPLHLRVAEDDLAAAADRRRDLVEVRPLAVVAAEVVAEPVAPGPLAITWERRRDFQEVSSGTPNFSRSQTPTTISPARPAATVLPWSGKRHGSPRRRHRCARRAAGSGHDRAGRSGQLLGGQVGGDRPSELPQLIRPRRQGRPVEQDGRARPNGRRPGQGPGPRPPTPTRPDPQPRPGTEPRPGTQPEPSPAPRPPPRQLHPRRVQPGFAPPVRRRHADGPVAVPRDPPHRWPRTGCRPHPRLVEEDLDAPIASARGMRVVGFLQDRSWWSRRLRPAFPVRHHHGHPGPGHDHRHPLPRPCPDIPEPHAGPPVEGGEIGGVRKRCAATVRSRTPRPWGSCPW